MPDWIGLDWWVGVLIGLGVGFFPLVPFVQAQAVANAACGDPLGDSNRTFSPMNWLWLLIGAMYWVYYAGDLVAPDLWTSFLE